MDAPTQSLRIDTFARAQALFHQAQQTAAVTIHTYRIAGFVVQCQFAGTALRPGVTPALAHLITNTDEPADLTLQIWDSASTQTAIPALSLGDRQYLYRGELPGNPDDTIRVTINHDPQMLHGLNFETQQGLFWMRDGHQMLPYQRAAPMVKLLLWWLEQRQRYFLHAGAVGTDNGAVLLAGKGGSGKSTTALACLQAGLTYLSDDFCLFSLQPHPQVYSLFNTGKLSSHSQDLLDTAERSNPKPSFWDDGKAVYFGAQIPGAALAGARPLRAIFLPQVTGERQSRLEPASPSQGLKVLAPSSLEVLMALAGSSQHAFAGMTQLVKRIPSYTLYLGTDLQDVVSAIADFLASFSNP